MCSPNTAAAAAAAAGSRVGAEWEQCGSSVGAESVCECSDRKKGQQHRNSEIIHIYEDAPHSSHQLLFSHHTASQTCLESEMDDIRRWRVAFKQALNQIIKLGILKYRPGESGGLLVKEVGRSLREPQ